jgi:hypothetical protein
VCYCRERVSCSCEFCRRVWAVASIGLQLWLAGCCLCTVFVLHTQPCFSVLSTSPSGGQLLRHAVTAASSRKAAANALANWLQTEIQTACPPATAVKQKSTQCGHHVARCGQAERAFFTIHCFIPRVRSTTPIVWVGPRSVSEEVARWHASDCDISDLNYWSLCDALVSYRPHIRPLADWESGP